MENERKALIFGIATVLMWSTVATAFKLSLTYLTPSQLVLLASIASSVVLGSILGWQGKLHLSFRYARQHLGYYLLLGSINPFAYYLVLFEAYDRLPAQQAQSLNYTWAITLSLMAALFLRQPLRLRDGIALSFGYLGAVIIATHGDLLAFQFDSFSGVLLALLSTLLWASYWILNARNHSDPIASIFTAFIISLPLSLIWCWSHDGLPPLELKAWSGALYIGLFEMGLAFTCWVIALKSTRHTARIANLVFISPPLSLYLIATLLDEPIEPSTYAGLSLIMVGLATSQLKRTSKTNTAK